MVRPRGFAELIGVVLILTASAAAGVGELSAACSDPAAIALSEVSPSVAPDATNPAADPIDEGHLGRIVSRPDARDALDEFGVPAPRLIEHLRSYSHRTQWYVSTANRRYLLRIDRIGPAGLAGLSSPRSGPVPTSLGWNEIARIDLRTSHRTAGSMLGGLMGTVAGGFLGGTIGNAIDPMVERDRGTALGTWAGGIAGAWFGGRIGDRRAHEEPLYIATPDAGWLGDDIATSAGIDKVRAHRRQLLRVRGSFGQFVGRVGSVSDEGLAELRADAADGRLPTPVEPIGWDQITGVEQRGLAMKRGAVIGAVSGAAYGAFVMAMIVGLTPKRDRHGSLTTAVALGGVAGAMPGAALGALAGSLFRQWHPIYRAPVVTPS